MTESNRSNAVRYCECGHHQERHAGLTRRGRCGAPLDWQKGFFCTCSRWRPTETKAEFMGLTTTHKGNKA